MELDLDVGGDWGGWLLCECRDEDWILTGGLVIRIGWLGGDGGVEGSV